MYKKLDILSSVVFIVAEWIGARTVFESLQATNANKTIIRICVFIFMGGFIVRLFGGVNLIIFSGASAVQMGYQILRGQEKHIFRIFCQLDFFVKADLLFFALNQLYEKSTTISIGIVMFQLVQDGVCGNG